MKNPLLIIIFIACSLQVYSQSGESTIPAKKFTFQVGINATDFIRQFIVLNSNNLNLPVSPYLINFKVFENVFSSKPDLKVGIRTGAGYTFKESSSTSNNSSSDFITRAEKTDFRIGVEMQQAISKKLVIFYGADYFLHNETNHTESRLLNKPQQGQSADPTITENKLTYKGVNAVLGLQFNINRYLNLNTEMLFGYRNGQGSTITSGPNLPNGQRDASGIREFFIGVPSFINLNFMF